MHRTFFQLTLYINLILIPYITSHVIIGGDPIKLGNHYPSSFEEKIESLKDINIEMWWINPKYDQNKHLHEFGYGATMKLYSIVTYTMILNGKKSHSMKFKPSIVI